MIRRYPHRLGLVPRQLSLACLLFLSLGPLACRREQTQKDQQEAAVQAGWRLLGEDPDRALHQFSQAKDDKDPKILLGKALALEGKSDWKAAETAYRSVVAALPQASLPRTGLGRTLLLQGRFDEAREELQTVLERDPSQLQALLLLALLAQTPAERDQALTSLLSFPKAWQAAFKKAEEAEGQARKDAPTVSKSPDSETPPAEYFAITEALLRKAGRTAEAEAQRRRRQASALFDQRAASALFGIARFVGQDEIALSLAGLLVVRDLEPAVFSQIADLALAQGKPALAREALGRLPVLSRDPEILLLRARLHLELDSFTDAATKLREARRLVDEKSRPKLARDIELRLAEALAAGGQEQAAREVLASRLGRDPKDLGVRLALAQLTLSAGDQAAAADLLAVEATASDTDPRQWLRLGLGQLAAGSSARAEQTLRALQKAHPHLPGLSTLIAETLIAQNQPTAASNELKQAAEEQPTDIRLLSEMAVYFFRIGRSASALTLVEKASEKHPEQLELTLLLAELYLKTNRKKELAKLFQRLEESDSEDPRASLALSRFKESIGDLEAALGYQKKATVGSATAPSERRRLASLLIRTGDDQAAVEEYEAVLEQDPDDIIALNNAASLYVERLDDPKKAIPLARKANRLRPFDPAIEDTLGTALLRGGEKSDLAEARQFLERASARLGSAQARVHLAEALLRSGDAGEARRLLNDALSDPKLEGSERDRAEKLLASAAKP